MFTLAVMMFEMAAVGGITLAVLRFRGKNLPMPLALAHGLFAAAGLVLILAISVRQGLPGAAGASLWLFLAAALGGFFLFSYHLRTKLLPTAVVLVHGLLALSGFALLLAYVLGKGC